MFLLYCFKLVFHFFFWHCHGEVSIPFILLYFFALSSCAPLYILYEATVETRKTSFASRATFLSQFLALFHAIPAMERRAVQYTIASSTSQHQIGETRSCFPRTARLFGLDVLRKSKAHTHSQRGACTKVRCTVGSCWHLLHLKNNGLIKWLSRPPCERGTRGKPCRQRQGEQILIFFFAYCWLDVVFVVDIQPWALRDLTRYMTIGRRRSAWNKRRKMNKNKIKKRHRVGSSKRGSLL